MQDYCNFKNREGILKGSGVSMNQPAVLTKMKEKFHGGDFLEIADYTKEELMNLIEIAVDLKAKLKNGVAHRYLEGKSLAMIFEKSSTRTRVSFEAGMYQLGGTAQFLSSADMQLGNGETISDTAKVLSRFVDAIMIRTYGHEIVEELAESGSIPVINGLTDMAHPCQALADLVTIYEKKGSFENLKLVYIGDGNNVTHSLIMACAIVGIECHIAVPEGHEVDAGILAKAVERAAENGTQVIQTNDQETAIKDADIIYTDVWASMGWEGDMDKLLKSFEGYQVNEELVSAAKNDYLFMHCLPANRGEEVTDGVIDSENSVVFDQAENRLHAQKAVLAVLV